MDRAVFDAGANPRPGFLAQFKKDLRAFLAPGDQVFFSFTTDPFPPPPSSHELTLQCLEAIRAHGRGIGFCTLTKSGLRSLAALPLFRPAHDAYAITLTSMKPSIVRKWEPNAAPPAERVEALRAFHAMGIFTWLSLEPAFSIDDSLEVIDATDGLIDFIKVGRANYIGSRVNWREYTAVVLKSLQQKPWVQFYFKEDLQSFLPDLAVNGPQRIRQNHGL